MERELNYLVLRYLENYLSKEDYESMKEKVSAHPIFSRLSDLLISLTVDLPQAWPPKDL